MSQPRSGLAREAPLGAAMVQGKSLDRTLECVWASEAHAEIQPRHHPHMVVDNQQIGGMKVHRTEWPPVERLG